MLCDLEKVKQLIPLKFASFPNYNPVKTLGTLTQ